VQEMLAKEKTPVLAGTIPLIEIFMSRWDVLVEKRPWLKPYIDEGLKWAKKYYIRMDQTSAYIIGMCKLSDRLRCFVLIVPLVINPAVRLSWINNNWEDEWKDKAIVVIKSVVRHFSYL
jgi:hypothetical protein